MASVTGNAPTGSVSFTDNGAAITGCTALGLAVSGNTGTAACTTATLTVGSHTIVASYCGDAANGTSSNTLTEVINAGGGAGVFDDDVVGLAQSGDGRQSL